MNGSFYKLRGFTLAETLITLGIIGVVAAMTIPVLVSNYQERQIATKLKKNVSLINQASRLAQNDDIVLEKKDYEDNQSGEDKISSDWDLDFLLDYLTVAQDCGHEAKGCFSENYKQLNGLKERNFEQLARYKKFVLMDGSSIAFEGWTGENLAGEMWIDVNGKQKPNIVGRDIFLFRLNGYVIYPYYKDSYNGKVSASGYNAASWVLQNNNLDYLHKKK